MIRYKVQNISAMISGTVFLFHSTTGITEEHRYSLLTRVIGLFFIFLYMGSLSYTSHKKKSGVKYIENDSLFTKIATVWFLIGIGVYIIISFKVHFLGTVVRALF